jgi:VWFA-related protein
MRSALRSHTVAGTSQVCTATVRGSRVASTRRWLAALLAMTLALPGALAAQDARPGIFGEVLDVRVVNVEVVVTDKQGARVRGLTPADFRLTVDGDEVPIEFFTEVVGGVAAETAAGSAGGARAQLAGGEPLGVSWLVYIDDYFAIGRDRDDVLQALRKQIGNLGPADRMAVVAWDGRRLAMLSSWTSSLPALERALEEAEKRPAHGLERLAEWRSVTDPRLRPQTVLDPRRTFGTTRLDVDERHYVEVLAEQVRSAGTAAAAALRAFANPPGRKAMLLLSGGWPWRPADFLLRQPGLLPVEDRVPEGSELLAPFVETANLLGYSVFPVDVPGLADRLIDASESLPVRTDAELVREQEVHATLHELARATGGEAMINATRLDALDRAIADTRSFYWLGFTPSWQGNDRHHAIQVEMRQRGLEVRAREGFRDLSRTAEVSMAVESALLFGNPPSTASLTIALGKPETKGRRLRVPLQVMVPTAELTAVPAGEEWVVTGELRVAAQDDDGRLAPVPVIPLELRLPERPVEGQMARYTTALELRRTSHDLVVSLYDPASGKLFSATARVAP